MVISYRMDIYHQAIKYLDKMNFGLTQEIDAEAGAKSNIVFFLSENLRIFYLIKTMEMIFKTSLSGVFA